MLEDAGAAAALVPTLEVGQYWTRQTNLLGAKGVQLGTGHAVAVPWLTGRRCASPPGDCWRGARDCCSAP